MKISSCYQWLVSLVVFLLIGNTPVEAQRHICNTVNRQNGLSDNHILQMIQIADGRLAIYTERGINIYDGQSFKLVPLSRKQRSRLPAYNGETHLYLDKDHRLWVKDHYAVTCVDLRRLAVVPSPLDSLASLAGPRPIEDIYIDSRHDIWTVSGRTLLNLRTRSAIIMPRYLGPLQDLDVQGNNLYAFFGTGKAVHYDLARRKMVHVSTAYGPADAALYFRTSLIVKGTGGVFYQIRTGHYQSIFLTYDPHTHAFREIYRCPYILNTLNAAPDSTALICSSNGYLLFDLKDDARCQSFTSVQLPDGTSLSTGINTIYPDRQKGVWLGTYHNGLLYASSLFNLFDTQVINIPVTPILSSISLNGVCIRQGEAYDDRILFDIDTPFVEYLNPTRAVHTLTFTFCTMNLVRPRNTFYRYRLDRQPWQILSADRHPNLIDNHGVLSLSLVDLEIGTHVLHIQASTNPHQWTGTTRTIRIDIPSPWWGRWQIWIIVILAASVMAFYLLRRTQKRSEELSARLPVSVVTPPITTSSTHPSVSTSGPTEYTEPQPAAIDFMDRAATCVRQHLAEPEYGVEQLAIDMCLERTGLYKKITTLTHESPVTFIRNIRLNHAASLLREGHHSVNEIALLCGFSSASYFTKCFKQRFGVRPSEYIG